MAKVEEGLNAVAPMHGAGPTNYEQALEVCIRDLHRERKNTRNNLAAMAVMLRMKIEKGSADALDIYTMFGTLFPGTI